MAHKGRSITTIPHQINPIVSIAHFAKHKQQLCQYAQPRIPRAKQSPGYTPRYVLANVLITCSRVVHITILIAVITTNVVNRVPIEAKHTQTAPKPPDNNKYQ
jgi:hypothetical protein